MKNKNCLLLGKDKKISYVRGGTNDGEDNVVRIKRYNIAISPSSSIFLTALIIVKT